MAKIKKVLEAAVKKEIKELLKKHNCWFYMPVPYGYGSPSLDFLGAKSGRMFGIEAKAPGEKPTKRQILTMTDMANHDIPCFVCDGTNLEELERWIVFLK